MRHEHDYYTWWELIVIDIIEVLKTLPAMLAIVLSSALVTAVLILFLWCFIRFFV